MVLAITSVFAWATVGSGGGDLNGGALGCPPGVHAMGVHGTSVQQHRPAKIVHTLNFVGHVRERPLVIGFDTFSELDVVRKSVVERSWKVLDHEGLRVTGVGEARFGKLLEMPIRYRYTGRTQGLQVRVADDQHMPTGVDVLCGTETQQATGAKFDSMNERLELWNEGVAIVMEPAWILRARIRSPPLRVLELCAGVSGSHGVFRDMGYAIKYWHAVESDEKTRRVAEAMSRGKVQHVSHKIEDMEIKSIYDVALAGPPCQPWSRANPEAAGFDDDRAEVFIRCAKLINEAREVNRDLRFMCENVVMSDRLKVRGDAAEQEYMMGHEFEEMNMMHYGAPQSRTRRISQNVTDEENHRGVQRRDSLDPDVVLRRLGVEHDWQRGKVANCVMASGDSTHNPPMVVEIRTGTRRPANNDECEALMGAEVGASTMMGQMQLTYAERARMIGNAFHYELVRSVFSEMLPRPQGAGSAQTISELHQMESEKMRGGACKTEEGEAAPPPGAQETYLSGLTDEEMDEYLRGKWEETGGGEMAKLKVELKDINTVAYQVPKRSRYQTPGKLKKAALAATKLKLKEGTMRLVKYEANQWISQMFIKGKGRVDPATGEEAVRFLSDLRSLNNAIDYPAQWN